MKLESQNKLTEPLTQASFLILLSIASQPRHGYLIMQTINSHFESDNMIGPGTLYRTLQRLRSSALIEESDSGAASVDDERRISYEITASGRRAVRHEIERLKTLLTFAKAAGLEP